MKFKKGIIISFKIEMYNDFEVIISTISSDYGENRNKRDAILREKWPDISDIQRNKIWAMYGNCVEDLHNKAFVTISTLKVDVIIHELLHVCHIIMLSIGMKLSRETEEPVAYLMGYLTKKTFEQLLVK